MSIDLGPQADQTRGTGPQTIASKLVVQNSDIPVASNTVLQFTSDTGLVYQALLYELQDGSGNAVDTSPNWFGVAIPSPGSFDLSSDVYVVLYFHPTPHQAGYDVRDYLAKNGAHGTDWKRLYAYVDRLGGQMAGAFQAGAPNNRLAIFPFLRDEAGYTLATGEWFNVIHDILQDINTNLVTGICTRPKKMIVATFSDGSGYLNKFLTDAASDPNNSRIIEAWDFDSDVSQPRVVVDPHGKRLRAYWQGTVPSNTSKKTYIALPGPSWKNFPSPPPAEVPPLPPEIHHHIRDTMLLDATWNIENDNP